MNFKILFILILTILVTGCSQSIQNQKNIEIETIQKYKNTGFALIYNDDLLF